MICSKCLSIAAIAAVAGTIALAQHQPVQEKPSAVKPSAVAPAKTPQPAHADKPAVPEGMTEEEMQACMEAATPGPMHAWLAESAGTWAGKVTMWMTPGSEACEAECTTTITPLLDGRFIQMKTEGEIPDMGPFHGFGVYGYDNVAKEFQSVWMDSCGTGMMTGKGELSSDQTTLTWTCSYNCPLAKREVKVRQIERRTGKNTMSLEMYATDFKSGVEFKTLRIDYTRQSPAKGDASH